MNMKELYGKYKEDVDSVSDWCDDMYNTSFSSHFNLVHSLHERMLSKSHPITDDELRSILIDLPLELFEVSEEMNKLQIQIEVIKMRIKQMEKEYTHRSTESTATKRAEEGAFAVLEDKLLLTAYNSVASRVEKEISFSRELIMGAKKVWDGRRSTESANPIGPNSYDSLPNYDPQSTGSSYYIK